MVPKEFANYQSTSPEISAKIKARKNEDLNLIHQIEKIFLNKRGFTIKPPSKHTPCVILATGGLDSTISTFILLKFFRVELYPLFINWGQKNLVQEKKAFGFFVDYFSQHYPRLYHPPKFITAHHPSKEIFNSRSNIVTLRNTTFANHAVTYSKYLEETRKVIIRTIFLNTTATDSDDCPDTSLTAIRTTNLNICVNENDYSWQIISLAIEKEFGLFLHKENTIALAKKCHLPLEKTWTCYQGGRYQCGQCFTCWSRQASFKKASIPDLTIYYNQTLLYQITHFFHEVRLKVIYKLTHLI